MYDVAIDDKREVTQKDVDRLVAVEQAYGRLRTAMADTHGRLMEQIGAIALSSEVEKVVPNELPTGDV
ncbi:MAG TPA: hypothetical protein VNU68_34965 [Verrucomicrobiae bacterium]|nr:hypothetical protein [Verrucomicrobiae bacterium]